MPGPVRTNDDRERERAFDIIIRRPKPTDPELTRLERKRLRAQREVYPSIIVSPSTPTTLPVIQQPQQPETTRPGTSPGPLLNHSSPRRRSPPSHSHTSSPRSQLFEIGTFNKLTSVISSSPSPPAPLRLAESRKEIFNLNVLLDALTSSVRAAVASLDTVAAVLVQSSNQKSVREKELFAQRLSKIAGGDACEDTETLELAIDTVLADLIRAASRKTTRLQKSHSVHLLALKEDYDLRLAALECQNQEQADLIAKLRAKIVSSSREGDTGNRLTEEEDEEGR